MENLTQSELINTILNLTKKVDQLKQQNDHLREIRIQLASLAVNNNFANDSGSCLSADKSPTNSLNKSTGPILEDTVNSQSISDDIFSCSNSIMPEYKIIRHSNDINESYSYLSNDFSDKIYNDSLLLKKKNRQIQFDESKFIRNMFLEWCKLALFVDIYGIIAHHCCYDLHVYNTFSLPSYLCGTIEKYILHSPFYNSIVLMDNFSCGSYYILKILSFDISECKITLVYGPELFDVITERFINKCGVTHLTWRRMHSCQLICVNVSDSIKQVAQQSCHRNFLYYLYINFVQSYLSYLMSYILINDWKTQITEFFVQLPFQIQNNPLKYFRACEFQDRSVKSYSFNVYNCRQCKPPIKGLMKNISNIPRNISTSRINRSKVKESVLRRASSVFDLRGNEFSENVKNLSEQLMGSDSLSTHFLYSQSRLMWHEKCKISFTIILRSTIMDIIFFIVCKASLPHDIDLEFSDENIEGLTKENVERRKYQIVDAQLRPPKLETVEPVTEDPTFVDSELIKLKSLNSLESSFFKWEDNNGRLLKNSKNIYDLKSVMKYAFPLTSKDGDLKSTMNISGLSRLNVQEMIKRNPEVFKKAFHQSRLSNKRPDSHSESTSTLVNRSNNQFYKQAKTKHSESVECKQTLSLCDSLTFADYSDNDLSVMNSQTEIINDTKPRMEKKPMKSLKRHKAQKEKRSSLQSQISNTKMRENSNKSKVYSRKQILEERKSDLHSDSESISKCTQSDLDYQEHKNNIKMAFIKHLNEMSAGDRFTKVNSLRKKAASYILNSKMSYNNWLRETNTVTSAHLKQFLDSEVNEKISNRQYRCDKCCVSFKLGTELRQHMRFHNFRKKFCVI